MIEELKTIILSGRLDEMINDGKPWNTANVDYDRPIVHRLWRQEGDLRVFLHEILPCEPGKPFFHPHPWPSAMLVLSGNYEMKTGYAPGVQAPPVAVSMILAAGSCYEMVNPDAWHSVRPIGGPSLSVMVSGPPWGRPMPKVPERQLLPLDEAKALQIRESCARSLICHTLSDSFALRRV